MIRISYVVVMMLIITTIGLCGYFWRKDWLGDHEDPRFQGANPDASSPLKVRNILLISIDTCRADYLSCYGYSQKTTPNIDALAGEAFQFTNAYSPVPLTLPAHCSMMTGTNPLYHGVHDNNDYQLDTSSITLAEVLKLEGFTNGAIIAAVPLYGQFGLNQGFDLYDDALDIELESQQVKERRAEQVSRRAIDWIDEHQRDQFFLFVHYFDPHDEYDPPQPFRSGTNDRQSLYAGEIAYTDHWIGQLIDRLKALSLYESTLIIITSDHGEMLGEHGELTHSFFVYRNALRVPLLIRFPGQRRTQRIKHNVGLIDIMPTVCGVLGIEAPPDVRGIDLSAYFEGQAPQDERYLYCESLTPTKYVGSPLLGILTGRWQYIHTARPELYDLSKDPQQLNNLVASEPETAQRLRRVLQEMVTQQRRQGAAAQLSLDEQALKDLESLGYVGRSSVNERFDFAQMQEREDPKDLIIFHSQHARVVTLVHRQEYDEAISLCTEMLERRPKFIDGYLYMAKIAMDRRQFDQAAEYLDDALRINPEDVYAILNMGRVLRKQDRYEEAVRYFRRALEVRPDFVTAHLELGLALQALEKFDEAIEHYQFATRRKQGYYAAYIVLASAYDAAGQPDKAEAALVKALELAPNHVEARVKLGSLVGRMGRLDEAMSHFHRALALSPEHADAHYWLSVALQMQDRGPEAIDHYRRALASNPNLVEAHGNLGLLLGGDEAIKHYRKAIALDPRYVQARVNLANALTNRGALTEAIEHYEVAIELAPNSAQVHYGLGSAVVAAGYLRPGSGHLRQAIDLARQWPLPYVALAQVLAMAPDASLRDPQEAVRLGREAARLTGYSNPQILQVLAAVYASAGQFEGAVTTTQQALLLARKAGNAGLEKQLTEKLNDYMQGKPQADVPAVQQPAP